MALMTPAASLWTFLYFILHDGKSYFSFIQTTECFCKYKVKQCKVRANLIGKIV